jgi:hypothetical protein
VTDALEDRVGAAVAGRIAYPCDCLVTAVGNDVRRAELPRQRDPVGMTAKKDDAHGAEAAGGDDAARSAGFKARN